MHIHTFTHTYIHTNKHTYMLSGFNLKDASFKIRLAHLLQRQTQVYILRRHYSGPHNHGPRQHEGTRGVCMCVYMYVCMYVALLIPRHPGVCIHVCMNE